MAINKNKEENDYNNGYSDYNDHASYMYQKMVKSVIMVVLEATAIWAKNGSKV